MAIKGSLSSRPLKSKRATRSFYRFLLDIIYQVSQFSSTLRLPTYQGTPWSCPQWLPSGKGGETYNSQAPLVSAGQGCPVPTGSSKGMGAPWTSKAGRSWDLEACSCEGDPRASRQRERPRSSDLPSSCDGLSSSSLSSLIDKQGIRRILQGVVCFICITVRQDHYLTSFSICCGAGSIFKSTHWKVPKGGERLDPETPMSVGALHRKGGNYSIFFYD